MEEGLSTGRIGMGEGREEGSAAVRGVMLDSMSVGVAG